MQSVRFTLALHDPSQLLGLRFRVTSDRRREMLKRGIGIISQQAFKPFLRFTIPQQLLLLILQLLLAVMTVNNRSRHSGHTDGSRGNDRYSAAAQPRILHSQYHPHSTAHCLLENSHSSIRSHAKRNASKNSSEVLIQSMISLKQKPRPTTESLASINSALAQICCNKRLL